MKLHLKRTRTFTSDPKSMLAVAVLAISATFLGAAPVHAQTATTTALQCQLSSNGNGNNLTCNGTTPFGNVTLTCQSPAPISDNNGVYATVSATCTDKTEIAGTSVSLMVGDNPITVDSNGGVITANEGGNFSVTINNGLASVTATGQGTRFAVTSAPFLLDLTNGQFTVTASVIGIGLAQISGQGSIGSVGVNGSTVTIYAPTITASTLLNLITANLACGSAVNVNLLQVFPIGIPYLSCNGS